MKRIIYLVLVSFFLPKKQNRLLEHPLISIILHFENRYNRSCREKWEVGTFDLTRFFFSDDTSIGIRQWQ